MDKRITTALIVTLLLWSSGFAGVRAGVKVYSPVHLALLRFGVAAAVLLVYALPSRLRVPTMRDLPLLLFIGFLSVPTYHVALNYGEVTVTAGAASLLINMVPIFTALLSTMFLRERLRAPGWAGILVGFGGTILIALGESRGVHIAPGAVLILIAAAAASLSMVVQKPILLRYTALELTTYTVCGGVALLLPALSGLPREIASAPMSVTMSVIYLGLFPGALAYITWAYALSRLPASATAAYLYLLPPLSLITAWFWLKEVPTFLSLVGGAVALCGVALVSLTRSTVTPCAAPSADPP